jgi:hypothetical protein
MTNLFLFASFGFFEGIGRVVDLGSTMVGYNYSPSIKEADRRALNSDLQAVGYDLENAVNSYAQTPQTEE